MTSERADQSATPDNHPQHGHPGATLAAQREALGWSVEQVAEQLKLAVRQVVAIEAGDYASLPSPAVTRGFVRAYAKILKLDAAPLVAMIKMDEPAPVESGPAVRRERPTSFSHSRFPTHGKRSSLPLRWIAAAVVVAAAAGAAWHFGLIALPGGDAPEGNDVITTVPADSVGAGATDGATTTHNPTVPLISVPAPGGAAAPAAPAGQGPAVTPGAVAPNAAPNTAPGATPAANAPVANAPAAVVTATPAAPAGANTLVLNVREDSWIEVRPQGGKALISRLVKAGSTETFDVPGTATLVVGNPKGVTATLRGAAVELPQLPGKTISRVTIK
ncbi:RodZ domain-containing protein [Massilia sp.]|uniref:RodZ domain-containing protein n=1 Tax=Massilia sp. TaxID=1882437 RepID=UPI0028B09713|nr:RodZ domain-containing protein [Massilia sp.]